MEELGEGRKIEVENGARNMGAQAFLL